MVGSNQLPLAQCSPHQKVRLTPQQGNRLLLAKDSFWVAQRSKSKRNARGAYVAPSTETDGRWVAVQHLLFHPLERNRTISYQDFLMPQ